MKYFCARLATGCCYPPRSVFSPFLLPFPPPPPPPPPFFYFYAELLSFIFFFVKKEKQTKLQIHSVYTRRACTLIMARMQSIPVPDTLREHHNFVFMVKKKSLALSLSLSCGLPFLLRNVFSFCSKLFFFFFYKIFFFSNSTASGCLICCSSFGNNSFFF